MISLIGDGLEGASMRARSPFKDWGKLFHNSAAAVAIADRLVHKSLLVRITGKSKRSDQETA